MARRLLARIRPARGPNLPAPGIVEPDRPRSRARRHHVQMLGQEGAGGRHHGRLQVVGGVGGDGGGHLVAEEMEGVIMKGVLQRRAEGEAEGRGGGDADQGKPAEQHRSGCTPVGKVGRTMNGITTPIL